MTLPAHEAGRVLTMETNFEYLHPDNDKLADKIQALLSKDSRVRPVISAFGSVITVPETLMYASEPELTKLYTD